MQAKHTLERKEMYEEQRDEALADLKKAEARCVPHIPKYALMLADLWNQKPAMRYLYICISMHTLIFAASVYLYTHLDVIPYDVALL